MKNTFWYWLFVIFGLASCVASFMDTLWSALIFRNVAILTIVILYFKAKAFSNLWFYLGALVSMIGESFLILGFENYIRPVMISYILYAWILLFMIKKGIDKLKLRLRKERLPSVLISAFLIIYLILNTVGLITPALEGNVFLAYGFVASFFVLLIYISFVYITASSELKYLWLLFFTMSVVVSSTITSMDAFYYQSIWLSQIGNITVIASHLFILNFLIAPNKEFSLFK